LNSGGLPTKTRVGVLIPSLLSVFTVLITLAFQWICLLNIAVSLANALNRSSALEAKLKTATKALGEADKKHAEEVAATKLVTDQAVKEAEARATKAKKALDEVSKKQARREEVVVKRIDDLLTSIGSKCSFPVVLHFLCVFHRPVFLLVMSS
jgi:biopolymer transport protein ExbB/TolQ